MGNKKFSETARHKSEVRIQISEIAEDKTVEAQHDCGLSTGSVFAESMQTETIKQLSGAGTWQIFELYLNFILRKTLEISSSRLYTSLCQSFTGKAQWKSG